ncbi:MAG: pyridoxal phosphate-dependent aminotransferase family protein [Chitinophagales bacterium]|nr:pyridoxal phosphate-dependent aminotransferase family protein [Chitinophagales bacterium]
MNAEYRINSYLQQRKENHLYRQLTVNQDSIDFSSNDYLGLSRAAFIRQQVDNDYKNNFRFKKSGATGSRLLNGNSELYDNVEAMLAKIHHAEAALIYNSGFDANVGLISTVARPSDTIFYDEMVHASIHQGMRLSGATLISYKHNNYEDLEEKLKEHSAAGIGFIVTESIFSMEGDRPDLKKLAELAGVYAVHLILDEAHATGLFGSGGSGLCNVAGIEDKCFARIYTFGKAIGSHGAVVIGSQNLKEYLINFSKNFIYSTALETHNLLCVKHSYIYLQNNINQLFKLVNLNNYFKNKSKELKDRFEIRGDGPIFGIIVPGNKKCKDLAFYLQNHNLDVRAILTPTVPERLERLRIILHSFNTSEEIDQLFSLLIDYK